MQRARHGGDSRWEERRSGGKNRTARSLARRNIYPFSNALVHGSPFCCPCNMGGRHIETLPPMQRLDRPFLLRRTPFSTAPPFAISPLYLLKSPSLPGTAADYSYGLRSPLLQRAGRQCGPMAVERLEACRSRAGGPIEPAATYMHSAKQSSTTSIVLRFAALQTYRRGSLINVYRHLVSRCRLSAGDLSPGMAAGNLGHVIPRASDTPGAQPLGTTVQRPGAAEATRDTLRLSGDAMVRHDGDGPDMARSTEKLHCTSRSDQNVVIDEKWHTRCSFSVVNITRINGPGLQMGEQGTTYSSGN